MFSSRVRQRQKKQVIAEIGHASTIVNEQVTLSGMHRPWNRRVPIIKQHASTASMLSCAVHAASPFGKPSVSLKSQEIGDSPDNEHLGILLLAWQFGVLLADELRLAVRDALCRSERRKKQFKDAIFSLEATEGPIGRYARAFVNSNRALACWS